MIRHGYSGCGVCHVDPSGAGLLTDYGRAQSDLLMATRWSTEKLEEASPTADFGFGLFNLPDWLFLGFSYRGGELVARSTTNNDAGEQVSTATDRRWVHMVADLRAGLRIGRFRASGALDTGGQYVLTLDTPGTYPYFCTLHPRMTGRIVVS